MYVEVKRQGRSLTRDQLVGQIADSVRSMSKAAFESEFIRAYELPTSVIQADPRRPWNLSSPKDSLLRRIVLSAKGSLPLGDLCDIKQGVTPGGGCLDVFLVDENTANMLEGDCIRLALEADDIITWRQGETGKRLIYPYDDNGKPLDLGKISLDLAPEKAKSELDRRIVAGSLKYPKTARYLIENFPRLSSRIFEKGRLSDYGKEWYEYHRPREAAMLRKTPKIVTRRMTKAVQFSLDNHGVLPTDGCFAIIPRDGNALSERLEDLGLKRSDIPDFESVYLLSILNSAIVRFLLKSSADFWQGGFYQVREEFLESIPVKLPIKENLADVKSIVKYVIDSKFEGNVQYVDKRLLEYYGLAAKQNQISEFLKARQ
jgi:TaqI-like C-terminal specificity domain